MSERLRKCRKDSHMSQNQVAIYYDITENAYQNYELMKRVPKLEIIIKLANLFDVSIDFLVGRTYKK